MKYFLSTGRSVLLDDPLSDGLPVQASKGCVHNTHLPPKHQLKRINLLRYPQVAVVASTHNLKRCFNFHDFSMFH